MLGGLLIKLTFDGINIFVFELLYIMFFLSIIACMNLYYKGWILKLENNILYIESGVKSYVINIKDIVNVKKTYSHYRRKRDHKTFIHLEIKYIDGNKTKTIALFIKKFNRIVFYDSYKEKEIDDFIEIFIKKNDTKSFKNYNDDYIVIRTQDENEKLEQILKERIIWDGAVSFKGILLVSFIGVVIFIIMLIIAYYYK